ncbi:TlpA disulfide reductase family protein [Fontimonas sp. SYSU GA230001]|uniref:TlpA family protein disulfide reductase n=1 Tax=Fontimonas sp. SYSU GA230001 TaxID=3142450 RepID=UPI0032B45802
MRQGFAVLALALVAGIAGFYAYQRIDRSPALIGREAPPLVLRDAAGQAHALAALRGRWVLLNFWASWCAPCMDELPLLVDAQRRYAAQGLQILGPALDDADAVAPVIARFGINYPVMPDFAAADAAMQALGNDRGALPYSVLIDPQGRIADRVLGGLSRDALESLITSNLGQ